MIGKSALVLAGGGLTGAVYEIGALCAIEDLLVDRTINDFDIFVGTSAGALVASLLANGLNPREMLQGLDGSHAEMPPIEPRDILNINRTGLLRSGFRFPQKLLATWYRYLFEHEDRSLFDLVWSLSETLPAGLYDPLALEKYVRRLLAFPGFSNDFASLSRALFIIATNLDSGDRAVFGADDLSHVPISLAVAASSALPILYRPVRIGRQEYVDGGIRGNASLDLAIEQGATLVVCINPIVPYVDTRLQEEATGNAFLSDKGIKAVTNQTLSILLHSGLHYHVKQLRRRHPDVDIILIEPQGDDENLHFDNIMQYSARMKVAQHGFQSVTLDLAQDFAYYRAVLLRHGIPVTRRLLVEEMQQIWQSGQDPAVLRKILLPQSTASEPAHTTVQELGRTLAALEELLSTLSPMSSDETDEQPPALAGNGHRPHFSQPVDSA